MPCSYDRLTELELTEPTLIEGLPGHGLVASIATDHIRTQLGLERHGRVTSESFPPVATYDEGMVRDTVRVYGGTDPDVLTLHSDIALPSESFRPLARCVMSDLSDRFGRAVFLAGARAESEDQIGRLRGVATDQTMREELTAADVPLAEDPGAIGGATGALLHECHRGGVPAAVVIVDAHPYLPDPTAAQAVVENALEPLVSFDVDTTELTERAEQIEARMEQVAEQYRQAAEQERSGHDNLMFQ